MAMNSLKFDRLQSMRFEQQMDYLAPQIMLKGLGRPWQFYAVHAALFAANIGGFFACFSRDLLRLLPSRCRTGTRAGQDEEKERKERLSLGALLFAKFLVWQHLAEAIGCRQGPMGFNFGLPYNWKYRLSLGTLKYPHFAFLGKKRNIVDLLVHALFFVSGIAFLKAKEYKYKYIRALTACHAWIRISDVTQFFASGGHAYFSMLLSACFPENQGRLAGIQTALIIQWFFSGVGKIGPWFGYVNGPFMLQSKILAGQRWLFDLLVRSSTDLRPTLFGALFAHAAAATEYLAPLALMVPRKSQRSLPSRVENGPATVTECSESAVQTSEQAVVPVQTKRDHLAKASIWFGLSGLVAMHAYILAMPAPIDVYPWNMSFLLSTIYLFCYATFGFDYEGAKTMNRGLAAFLLGEIGLCWYGAFFPDSVGYLTGHRYWAGNWVQTFFFVKNTPATLAKLGRVKIMSSGPQVWGSLQPLGAAQGPTMMAYLWLANLNMKSLAGLLYEGVRLAGGPGADLKDYLQMPLPSMFCGEIRDFLYAKHLLPTIQDQIGFEAGECFMLHLGAFGMFQDTTKWGIYDLKGGLLKSGLLRLSALSQMNSFPSQSIAALPALMD